jgi:hypothetical protein
MGDFDGLTYEDFRKRATEPGRSANEKIGFPDRYRDNAEGSILNDLISKLPALRRPGATVMDIGCGCGPLAQLLIEHCSANDQRLVLIDSEEMLSQLPRTGAFERRPHRFPNDIAVLEEFGGQADAIILYSVIQHEFISGNLWRMFDALCTLLNDGGAALIGDIPNRSMRTRLFNSSNGLAYHRAFTGLETPPPLPEYGISSGEIDDSVIFSLLFRARSQGIHAYVVPQPEDLPFANRREDILLRHP